RPIIDPSLTTFRTCTCAISTYPYPSSFSLFSFTDTPPTAIYTLSLHDALPICGGDDLRAAADGSGTDRWGSVHLQTAGDRRHRRTRQLDPAHAHPRARALPAARRRQGTSGREEVREEHGWWRGPRRRGGARRRPGTRASAGWC